jgi:hypothetical protein
MKGGAGQTFAMIANHHLLHYLSYRHHRGKRRF